MSANANLELAASLKTAVDLDEPEAALQTLQRFAEARAHEALSSPGWRKLAQLLDAAGQQLAGNEPGDAVEPDAGKANQDNTKTG